MKVIALVGGSKFGNTTRVVRYFSECLEKTTEADIEYVYPADYGIDFCVGCHNCILLGETKCPHHSAYAPIERKLTEADAVIMASPGYMFSVTGVMKNFLDHVAYNCHRPKYFGKKAYIIGNFTKWQKKSVFAPMETWLSGAGFEVCGKTYVDMLPFPLKEREMEKKRRRLEKAAGSFSRQLLSDKKRKPRTGDVVIFNIFRMLSKMAPGILKADNIYFSARKGDWYTDGRIPPHLNLIGRIAKASAHRRIARMIDSKRTESADGRVYNELGKGGKR